MCLKVSTRTDFFAQPGNGVVARLRANRTRLDRTILLDGPSRRAASAGLERISWMFIAQEMADSEYSDLTREISSRNCAAFS